MSNLLRARWLPLAIVVGLTSGCPSPQSGEPPPDPTELEAAALASFEQYQVALNEGDLDAALAFYSDDPNFHWVEEGAVRYDSKESIRSSLEQLSQMGAVTTDYADVRVELVGSDVALVTGLYETRIAGSGDGQPGFSFRGAMTLTLALLPLESHQQG